MQVVLIPNNIKKLRMNFRRKYVVLFLFITITVFAIFFYIEFQRKPADLANTEPALKVSATIIVELYQNNEMVANQQYLNKVIEVSGPISEIINQQDTLVNIMLGDTISLHKVSCLLSRTHFKNVKNYKAGQQIIIKGVCTGFLTDVELNRCVIVDAQTN